jgi:hypothetical protein
MYVRLQQYPSLHTGQEQPTKILIQAAVKDALNLFLVNLQLGWKRSATSSRIPSPHALPGELQTYSDLAHIPSQARKPK